MNKAIGTAEFAFNNRKGILEKYEDHVLLGYEYRMCIKLGTALSSEDGINQAFQRVCVDLRNLNIYEYMIFIRFLLVIDYEYGKMILIRLKAI